MESLVKFLHKTILLTSLRRTDFRFSLCSFRRLTDVPKVLKHVFILTVTKVTKEVYRKALKKFIVKPWDIRFVIPLIRGKRFTEYFVLSVTGSILVSPFYITYVTGVT